MRCYRWEHGKLEEGIVLNQGRSLCLGQNAQSGDKVWMGLHKTNPPHVRGKTLGSAYPYWVNPKSGTRFIVFARPHDKHLNDARVLLHVSTRGDGRSSGQGFWRIHEGTGETMLAGVVERDGKTWSEGLVVLEPDAVLRLRPARSDDDHAVVYGVNELYSESWIRHEARMLLQEEHLLRG